MDAGWYTDPTDRFDRRYWDGQRWTADVAIGTRHLMDPVAIDVEGAETASVPPRPPTSAFLPPPGGPASPPPPGAGATAPIAASALAQHPGSAGPLLEQLEPSVRDRPLARLADALAAVAGALIGIGVIAVGAGDDGSRAGLIIAALVVTAGGYAIALTLLRPLRPAAVALVAIGLTAFTFALLDATSDGELAGPFALLAVLAIAAYLAPGLRGRPFLLGLCVFALMAMFAWLAAEDTANVDDPFDADLAPFGDIDAVSAVLLLVGALYAGATALLDRRGWRGAGTVFAAAAIVGVVLGTLGTASRLGEGAGSVLVLLAGVVLGAVGNISGRRATMWTGCALVAGGVVALVAVILDTDSSTVAAGLLIVVGGLIVGAVAYVLHQRRRYVVKPPDPR